ILQRAEDLREWDKMKKYDDEKGTGFHRGLDVENPDKAVAFSSIYADWIGHINKDRPLDTFSRLLEAVKSLDSEELVNNGTSLRPVLQELGKAITKRIKMIDAAAD